MVWFGAASGTVSLPDHSVSAAIMARLRAQRESTENVGGGKPPPSSPGDDDDDDDDDVDDADADVREERQERQKGQTKSYGGRSLHLRLLQVLLPVMDSSPSDSCDDWLARIYPERAQGAEKKRKTRPFSARMQFQTNS